MSPRPSARLVTASPEFVERAPATDLADWLGYFDPGVVVLAGPSGRGPAARTLRRHADPDTVCFHPSGDGAGNAGAAGPRAVGGVQFVFAPTADALRTMADHERDELDPGTPTYVVSGLLELDVDPTTLSTSLVGREAYAESLPGDLAGEYVHVSTGLPADYRRDWGDFAVVGAGGGAGSAGTPLVALDCRADGRVLARTLRAGNLGLRALDGVGDVRARRLREAGVPDREAVADAGLHTLADVRGLGRTTAERVRRSARAIAGDEVVRTSDDPLPGRDPLYVDIETDGLSPTITWLIGVLDGSAADGEYRSFVARDADDPGRAVEAFAAWYAAHASGRPLVAYRGRAFDFRVLRDHVVEHCPRFEDDWRAAARFDPYRWAVEEDNAVLPGRTNRLEDVAGALGYERSEPGLTGAAVARAYRAWMADRSPEAELDWERFDAYCEDDVRALAVVYEALAEGGRIVSADAHATEPTTQGHLSDW